MQNILTYAEDSLDPFAVRPFGTVDSLILSWTANLRLPRETASWEGIPLRDLFRAELFPSLFQGIWDPVSTRALFTALAASPRFRDVLVMGSTSQTDLQQEKQFSAVTFRLSSGLCYAAFGGTDASFVGWKENFNMAFLSPVPSQAEAARYLTQAADHCTGDLLVGGHSKGGNLAVYAGASVCREIQDRIRHIFSHDGPGFPRAFLYSPGYQAIRDRVEKTVPQDSLVGLLLESEACQVIQSARRSFLQHDPFSWTVQGTEFLPEQLTDDARHWDRTLDDWVDQVSQAERERFVDALYDILMTTQVTSFDQLKEDWYIHLPAIMHAAGQLDPDTRSFLFRTLRQLGAIGLRNARSDTPPTL